MTRSRRQIGLGLLGLGVLLCSSPALAWELETHIGLTHRAALASRLDGWLRARGLAGGFYETLALKPDARHEPDRTNLDDRALLDELKPIDAALGVSPEQGRQPALGWLLAGAALEGARMDRVRNHFVDPHTTLPPATGLAETGARGNGRAQLTAARDAGGSVRGVFTGSNFDGTGVRADRWIEALDNPLSRGRMLDALERAASGETEAIRQAALARALVCAGAIAHVLEAVGDPAHARGDFTVNYLEAGAPLERWAAQRYGRSVPDPSADRTAPRQLALFVTAPDGTGLADEVAHAFLSPGTMPGTPGALPWPALVAGPEPRGSTPGALVRTLAVWHRQSDGVHWSLTPAAVAEAVDVLLPRITRRASQLVDHLFRGAIDVKGSAHEARFVIGALGLGPGHVTVLDEDEHGKRTSHFTANIAGGPPGTFLHAFKGAGHAVLVYRGVDEHGEPIVLTASSTSAR